MYRQETANNKWENLIDVVRRTESTQLSVWMLHSASVVSTSFESCADLSALSRVLTPRLVSKAPPKADET